MPEPLVDVAKPSNEMYIRGSERLAFAMLDAVKRLSRREWMAGAATVAALGGASLGYGLYIEPRWPELVHLEIPTRWLRGRERLRILHLSDLHASPVVPLDWLDEVFQKALVEKPDCLCLTGDYVTSGQQVNLASYRSLLSKLPAAVPVFASMGNHDGGKWGKRTGRRESSETVRKLLTEAGIQVCHNRTSKATIAGLRVEFAGLGDRWAKEFDPAAAFKAVARNAECLRVVLSHNPDTKGVLQYYSWELMLAGHTHGGQIVIPGFGPPVLPVVDRDHYQGLYEYAGRRLYVTRGVGGVFGGLRFFCRPEITVLDLTPGDGPSELTDAKPR